MADTDIVSGKDSVDGASIAKGEVLTPDQVQFAYTREGRHKIGHEYPNPIPLEPPLGWTPYEPLYEQITRMVLNKLHQEQSDGEELDTPDEADDFDVGDDYDPQSPWEEQFEPTEPWPFGPAGAIPETPPVETPSPAPPPPAEPPKPES